MQPWINCKNILCIRPDNMGDLVMSGPAIRALKESFGARITVLTSAMAAGVAQFMPEIDEVMVFDLPWVKTDNDHPSAAVQSLIKQITDKQFDAAVIFTVFSQSALPTAMIAYLAGIKQVLAYCRENPYQLISHWLPDDEPYQTIRHQVTRDLRLVQAVGAAVTTDFLKIQVHTEVWDRTESKLRGLGLDIAKPWVCLHIAASEQKRLYPTDLWAEAGQQLIQKGYQVVLTGSKTDVALVDQLQKLMNGLGVNLAGQLNLEELISLIGKSSVLLSVNTGTIHLAAAVGTPVVVLYAQTNPQHTPWGVPQRVLYFPVPNHLKSKNEVLTYLDKTLYNNGCLPPRPAEIVTAVEDLLRLKTEA